MKQFGKIFSFELKNYLKNKVFIGTTIFFVAVIAVVMFFPRISQLFKSNQTDKMPDKQPIMLVKAQTEELSDITAEIFSSSFADYEVVSTNDSIEKIKKKITSEEVECAFVMTGDTSYTYYVNNLSIYDINSATADETLKSLYQINAMVIGGFSPEQSSDIMNIKINGTTESLGVDQMKNYFYTYIMIFALYMVILLYGQMVATNVATEKSSRTMEVLITSAKPTSMMFGKVIASCLAGLIQLVAIFGSALLLFNINRSYWGNNMIISSIFDMPPILLIYMLIFFILGFLVYAFMFGAVGSTASKLEDINTSVTPITLMFVAGFLVVVMSFSSGTVDTTLMKVCSFIPFTSSMAMFTRIAMSTVPWYEIAISIGILAGSVAAIGVIAAKIYRIGVLLYGNPPKFSSIIKMIWKS